MKIINSNKGNAYIRLEEADIRQFVRHTLKEISNPPPAVVYSLQDPGLRTALTAASKRPEVAGIVDGTRHWRVVIEELEELGAMAARDAIIRIAATAALMAPGMPLNNDARDIIEDMIFGIGKDTKTDDIVSSAVAAAIQSVMNK